MNAADYQQAAARTLNRKDEIQVTQRDLQLLNSALGLSDEAGEVAGEIKKAIFHGHNLDLNKIEKELGDVLWYAAAVATTLGLELGTVMAENIAKLKVRFPDGFTTADSVARVDTSADGFTFSVGAWRGRFDESGERWD